MVDHCPSGAGLYGLSRIEYGDERSIVRLTLVLRWCKALSVTAELYRVRWIVENHADNGDKVCCKPSLALFVVPL